MKKYSEIQNLPLNKNQGRDAARGFLRSSIGLHKWMPTRVASKMRRGLAARVVASGISVVILASVGALSANADEQSRNPRKERDSYHLEKAVSSRDWSKVNCPKPRMLAQELLDILISGGGPQGFNPSCIVPTKFEHVRVMHFEDLDRSKALTLDDGTPYRIESVSTIEDGDTQKFGAQVVFFVREKNKIKRVKDTFVFRSYEGKAKTYFGCAAVLFPPQNLFTKKSCVYLAGQPRESDRVPASKAGAEAAARESTQAPAPAPAVVPNDSSSVSTDSKKSTSTEESSPKN